MNDVRNIRIVEQGKLIDLPCTCSHDDSDHFPIFLPLAAKIYSVYKRCECYEYFENEE